MRPRELELLVQDIQVAVRDVEEFTEGLTFQQYESGKMIRMAVERKFITIGEAITRMKDASEDANKRISSAVQISGFRNFLVHEYESVNDRQVWKVVQESMPILKQQIEAWAAELGMEAPPE